MKYIVTGGAGFIGSHIAESLLENHHEVTIIDDLSTGDPRTINFLKETADLTFIQADILDIEMLKKSFSEADGIFHEAAVSSVPRSIADPSETNKINITGTLNILLAARERNVKRIVIASSSSVYGNDPVLPKKEDMPPNPESPYAVSKLVAEYYCSVFSKLYDIQTINLRYFNVFGPRQNITSEYAAVIPKFITRILHHKPPVIYGDGEQTRDFVYVKDVIAANIKAMNSNKQGIYNIASGTPVSINTLASLISDIAGEDTEPVHENPRPGEIRHSYADIQLAEKALLFKPCYSLKRALTETTRWYQNQDTTR